MAITRSQQAKQMLQDGGMLVKPGFGGTRQGYRGDAAARSTGAAQSGRADPGSRGDPRDGPRTMGRNPMAQFTPQAEAIAKEMRDATMGAGDRFVPDIFPITKGLANIFQVKKPTPFDIQRRGFIKALGPQTVDTSGMDRGGDVPYWAQLGYSSEAEYLAALARAQAPSTTEQELEEEDEGLRLAFRANGGRIGFRGGDAARSDAASGRNAGRADPGGGVERGGSNRDRRRVEQYTKPPTTSGGGGGGKEPDTTLKFKKDIPDSFAKKFSVGDLINLDLLNDEEQDTMKVAGLNQEQVDYLNQVGKKVSNVDATGDFFTYDSPANVKSQLEKLNPKSESGIFSKEFDPGKIVEGDPNTYATEKDVQDYIKSAFPNLITGGRKVGLAEGGMPYEGGIMDLESARQMYGLGKLVKKVTRTVKKIAKSPIGKAALIGAAGFGIPGTSFGGLFGRAAFGGQATGLFGTQGIGQAFTKLMGGKLDPLDVLGGEMTTGKQNIFQKAIGAIPGGVTGAIVGVSALAGLLTPEQEDQAQALSTGEGIDIDAARRMILQAGTSGDKRALVFRADGGRIEYQEGSKEPVAKKTMPLLDMGGKEMDLREDGGFVPIGRMEKADDVPARLSKNEFVFTADAVRNAGDGDVDKGAEVMYNMMKNLEAGGDVSEESQGLEGARKMFQSSQRLEEVL